jgi:plasmid stability protein
MQSEYAHEVCALEMASLQIRDLPDPLHRFLQRRASAQKRSLSQQALADLESIAGGDPRQRRRLALERIAERWQQRQALPWEESPESLIRSDRER